MSSSPEADDADIYGDLPTFQFDEAFKNLEKDKAELQTKVVELGAKLVEMKKENDKLQAKIRALGKNISCLYKTAQREITRKEQIIADLRKERDDLLFRRGLQGTKSCNIRRPSRKQLTPTKKIRNGSIKMFHESRGKSRLNEMEENQKEVKHMQPIKSEFENIGRVPVREKEKGRTTPRAVTEPADVIDLTGCQSEIDCVSAIKPTEDNESKDSLELHERVSSVVAASEENTQSSPDNNRNEVIPPTPKPLLKECGNIEPIPAKQKEMGRKAVHEKVPEPEEVMDSTPSQPGIECVNVVNSTREDDRKTSLAVDVQVSSISELPTEIAPTTPDINKSIEMMTPVQDKISVHMSSEDCGFGRRRVRRVIKPAAALTSPVKASVGDRGVKCPAEEKGNTESESLKRLQLEIDPDQNDPRVQKRRRVDRDGLPKSGLLDSTSENNVDVSDSISHSCQMRNVNSSAKTDCCDLLVLKYGDRGHKGSDSDILTTNVLEESPTGSTSLQEQEDKSEKGKGVHVCEKKDAESDNKGINSDILKRYCTSFGVSAFEGSSKSENSVPKQKDRNGTMEELVNEMLSKPKATVQRPGSPIHKAKNSCPDRFIESLQGEHRSRNASPASPSCASENFNSPIASPRNEETTSRRSWDRERVNNESRPSDFRKTDRRERYSDQHGSTGHGHEERRRDFHEERGRGQYSEKGRGAQGRGYDRPRDSYSGRDSGHHKDQEKSRDGEGHESNNDRRRDMERRRHSDYDKDLHRGWDSDRGPDSERGWDPDRKRSSRDSDRSKDSNREWNPNRDRAHGLCRVTGRGSSRDEAHGSSRDRCSSRDRACDCNRDQAHGSSRDRERCFSRDRDWCSSRDRGRCCSRDRTHGSSKNHKRSSSVDRDSRSGRGRDDGGGCSSSQGRDLDRDQNDKRGKDPNVDQVFGRGRGVKNLNKSKDTDRERNQKQYRSRPDRWGSGEFGDNVDLRERLSNKNLTPARDKVDHERRNGYMDLDKSPEDKGEWKEKWCDKKCSGDKTGKRSPEKQSIKVSEWPTEGGSPFTPEWD